MIIRIQGTDEGKPVSYEFLRKGNFRRIKCRESRRSVDTVVDIYIRMRQKKRLSNTLYESLETSYSFQQHVQSLYCHQWDQVDCIGMSKFER